MFYNQGFSASLTFESLLLGQSYSHSHPDPRGTACHQHPPGPHGYLTAATVAPDWNWILCNSPRVLCSWNAWTLVTSQPCGHGQCVKQVLCSKIRRLILCVYPGNALAPLTGWLFSNKTDTCATMEQNWRCWLLLTTCKLYFVYNVCWKHKSICSCCLSNTSLQLLVS